MLEVACCAATLVVTAFAGSSPAGGRLDFVPAPAALKRACVATARFVGYPVPCPRLPEPRGLVRPIRPTPVARVASCSLRFRSIATCEGARGWRGWNDGSQFSDAVAAVWSAGGHSYAIGFVVAGGKAVARALGERLLEGVALVGAHG